MPKPTEIDLDIYCPVGLDALSNPCIVTATVEEGPDVPGGWRIVVRPVRCELNGIWYGPSEQGELDRRIERAYEQYREGLQTPRRKE